MPRAIRHSIPGHAWHITHRCHQKEFLLKFAKDRQTLATGSLRPRSGMGIAAFRLRSDIRHRAV